MAVSKNGVKNIAPGIADSVPTVAFTQILCVGSWLYASALNIINKWLVLSKVMVEGILNRIVRAPRWSPNPHSIGNPICCPELNLAELKR